MKFSDAKEKELKEKLTKIILDCVIEAKINKDDKYVSEWYFMEKVWYADLVKEPKQLFLLGALAMEIYSLAPKALETAMKAAGMITDESKLSKAREYWKDKYGDSEATLLVEKLLPAFSDEKYSLEDIKSMGDKIEIIRGNNKYVTK